MLHVLTPHASSISLSLLASRGGLSPIHIELTILLNAHGSVLAGEVEAGNAEAMPHSVSLSINHLDGLTYPWINQSTEPLQDTSPRHLKESLLCLREA